MIHGSTGSRGCANYRRRFGPVAVTALDGILVARSGFESSFQYRSAVLFGSFRVVAGDEKVDYLQALVDTFIPGRVRELRASSGKELAATLVLAPPIGADNWSLKIGDGWPEDPDDDVAAGWAGIVPITMTWRARAGRTGDPAIPVPPSVLSMSGTVANRRG